MKKISGFIVLILFSGNLLAQASVAGTAASVATEFLGWNAGTSKDLDIKNTFTGPGRNINFFTSNTQRAIIDASGNVGIGTTTPSICLTVRGNTFVNGGWKDGILVENGGTITFSNDGVTGNNFLVMSGASTSPLGDFFHYLSPNILGSGGNQILYRVYGRGRTNEPAQGIHEFFTKVLADTMLGVHTLFPTKMAEIYDSMDVQMRLTSSLTNAAIPTPRKYTDFQTTLGGNLVIDPQDLTNATNTGTFVGIHTTSPKNTLDINSNANSPYWPDASGLRLKNLTSSSTINMAANASNTVLSVDVAGDVVLVNGGSVSYCSSPVTFTADAAYTFGGNKLYFDAQNAGEDVGIGYGCTAILSAKLDVHESNNQYCISGNNISGVNAAEAVSGLSTQGTNQMAVHGTATHAMYQVGVEGDVYGAPSKFQIGGRFTADDLGATSITNQGVEADINSTGSTALNYGVKGIITAQGHAPTNFAGLFGTNDNNGSSPMNVGVNASAVTSNPTGINYGVNVTVNNGSAATISGNIGINVSATPSNSAGGNYAAYFNGDIGGVGTFAYTSDSALKQNIVPVTNSSSILNSLHPKYYQFNHSVHPAMNLPFGNQCGLLAQEVAQVAPDAVLLQQFPSQIDSVGNITVASFPYLALNYNYIFTLLVAGYQEQGVRIDQQDSRIDSLIAVINNCCNQGGGAQERRANGHEDRTLNQTDVVLSDLNAVILRQNVPNPFAEQTMIGYSIPESTGFAQIVFYDQLGRILKAVDINAKGEGQLNVFAPDLSSGIYTYSLIVDGKVMDHKKMLKTK